MELNKMDELCAVCDKSINGDDNMCLREKGVLSLNKCSKERGENKTFMAGQYIHKKCRKNYTRPQSILATQKRKSLDEEHDNEKRTLRSQIINFDFQTNCLFCAQPDKYAGKKKDFELLPVRTLEFQNSTKEVCFDRNDDWSTDVHARILPASDLHAADALYHQKCSVNFRTGRQIPHCFLG